MMVGLLGLQGAFLDHRPHLQRCGVAHRIVRDAADLAAVDRLIIPGGESTVMCKFLQEFGLLPALKARIADGLPVWGVCAGAIVLAATVDQAAGPIAALPVAVQRNAYGRQLASSQRPVSIPLFDISGYPAIYIRAPRITHIEQDVTVHAACGGDPVFVQHHKIIATTFHPELNPDDLFHHFFISL